MEQRNQNNNINASSDEKQSKKKREIGAVWLRKSKQGNSYLSGSIKNGEASEEIRIVIFKNSYKEEGSNQPDYRIYLDEVTTEKVSNKETTSSASIPEESDIPF
jgi:uncharacterized protein (DUF736 family)